MINDMKILNLYACLGGNRYKWDEVAKEAGIEIQVTAVELDPELARMYKERFPNDMVIIADAHQFLLDHYKEYDFIWSSPPCQTHSRTNYFTNEIRKIKKYPDMSLYQEIIYLNQFYKGLFCVENVIGYYDPLIKPIQIGRHYLWTNFNLLKIMLPEKQIGSMTKGWNTACKIPLHKRNAVNSDLGKHILETALGVIRKSKTEQTKLF